MSHSKFLHTSKLFIACICSFAIVSCGGSGTNGSQGPQKGFVIDSPVTGLRYDCYDNGNNHLTGVTDSKGGFDYIPGGWCELFVGSVAIGAPIYVPQDGYITPYDIAGVNRQSVDSEFVSGVAQFLQSIDEIKGDDIITIPAHGYIPELNFNVLNVADKSNSDQLLKVVKAINPSQDKLIPREVAMQSMNEYLNKANVNLMTLKTTSAVDNSHWMTDWQGILNDKKLNQILLPGTHESATYIGQNPWVTRTQYQDITTQLNDGIRYLDFRAMFDGRDPANECDNTLNKWMLWHQTDMPISTQGITFKHGLDQIRQYLISQSNRDGLKSRELIILHIQNVEVNPPIPANDYLVDYLKSGFEVKRPSNSYASMAAIPFLVEQYLGPWLVENDAGYNFKVDPISKLWSNNENRKTLNGKPAGAAQVIVIYNNIIKDKVFSGQQPDQLCGIKVEQNTKGLASFQDQIPEDTIIHDPYTIHKPYHLTESDTLKTYYQERQLNPSGDLQGKRVDEQLKADVASYLIKSPNGNLWANQSFFKDYADNYSAGKVNVMQYVARPSDYQLAEFFTSALTSLALKNTYKKFFSIWQNNLNLLVNNYAQGGVNIGLGKLSWLEVGLHLAPPSFDDDQAVMTPSNLCVNPWLSKRLQVASREGNMPNVLIVDNYQDPSVPWYSAIYGKDHYRWNIRGSATNFVDFVKNHNVKTGYYQFPLVTLTEDWQDNVCTANTVNVEPGQANDYYYLDCAHFGTINGHKVCLKD